VIINLDEVISLQNVHLMIPIDEINVQQNLFIENISPIISFFLSFYLGNHKEDVKQNNRIFQLFFSYFVSRRKIKIGILYMFKERDYGLQVFVMLVRFVSFVLQFFFQHDDQVKYLFLLISHPKNVFIFKFQNK
jgi:hypothetical protein